jgi:2'-5' RNA ligase
MTLLMTWLVPAQGAERDRLTAIIERLAAQNAAPGFPPHITIIPTLDRPADEAARALRSLTASVPPFDVSFPAFGRERAYFRALYLRAEPSARLTRLNQAASQVWALDPAPYRPHLSLLYADLADERKQAIIGALGLPLPRTVRIDAAELWADAGQGVPGWRRVARIPLANPPAQRDQGPRVQGPRDQ